MDQDNLTKYPMLAIIYIITLNGMGTWVFIFLNLTNNELPPVLMILLTQTFSLILFCYRKQWTFHSTLQQLSSGGFTAQGSSSVSVCGELPVLWVCQWGGFAQSVAASKRAWSGGRHIFLTCELKWHPSLAQHLFSVPFTNAYLFYTLTGYWLF